MSRFARDERARVVAAVAGIPVEVRGSIVGRGTSVTCLSPDMVIQDRSGFVPLIWRQPLPIARAWFGLTKVRRFMDQAGVASGWYRRTPGPVIEVGTVWAPDRRATRTWFWAVSAIAWALVLLAGLILGLVGIAGR